MSLEYKSKSSKKTARWGNAALLGCFATAALAMVVLISLSFLVPMAVDRVVETYTDAAPAPLEPLRITEEAGEALHERVEVFREELEEGIARDDLALSEDEVNFLLAEALRDEDFEGSLHLELRRETISAHVSLPVNEDISLGPWSRSVRGRYLNGIATVRVALAGEVVELDIVSVEVKGREIPGWLLRRLEQGIAESGILDSEDVREVARKLDGLEIHDRRVVFSPSRRRR